MKTATTKLIALDGAKRRRGMKVVAVIKLRITLDLATLPIPHVTMVEQEAVVAPIQVLMRMPVYGWTRHLKNVASAEPAGPGRATTPR